MSEKLREEVAGLEAAARAYTARHQRIDNLAWPDGARIAVNFTADFDAMLYRRILNEPPLQLAKGEFGGRVGIWRLIELKRAAYKLAEHDEDLKPWEERLTELGGELDDIDELFIEVDGAVANESGEVEVARGQLELFGTLLSSLADSKAEDGVGSQPVDLGEHSILTREGRELTGSWEEIVRSMRDADTDATDGSLRDYMMRIARRTYRETGMRVPSHDAELFVRGSADAGILRIVR